MIRIDTTTLTNQNITSGLLCRTYTASGDHEVFFRMFADQVAGNGSYYAWVTIQRSGTGSDYRHVPVNAALVDNGITSIVFSTIPLPVKSGDVVKVYIKGQAGDTTTPDITVETWTNDMSALVAGSINWPITIQSGGQPVDSVDVWVTTDLAGQNIIARGITDAFGLVTFTLDAGTYYCWKQHSKFTFTNPESFVVA